MFCVAIRLHRFLFEGNLFEGEHHRIRWMIGCHPLPHPQHKPPFLSTADELLIGDNGAGPAFNLLHAQYFFGGSEDSARQWTWAFFGLVFDYILSDFPLRSFLQIWIPCQVLFRAPGWAKIKVNVSSFSPFPPITIASRLVIVPFHRQFLHSLNVCTFPIPVDHSTHRDDDNDDIFSHSKSPSPSPSTVRLA